MRDDLITANNKKKLKYIVTKMSYWYIMKIL